MYNIAIIGLGKLGKRHLQSVLESELPLNIYCMDVNEYALKDFTWENRFNNKEIFFKTNMDNFPDNIDLAILSLSSKQRREVFEELIKISAVKNVIFEKVLFQKIEDYEVVESILKEKKINAYVNCSRREMKIYQDLKADMDECEFFDVQITGAEWGLGCNCIHMLDLIDYLDKPNFVEDGGGYCNNGCYVGKKDF